MDLNKYYHHPSMMVTRTTDWSSIITPDSGHFFYLRSAIIICFYGLLVWREKRDGTDTQANPEILKRIPKVLGQVCVVWYCIGQGQQLLYHISGWLSSQYLTQHTLLKLAIITGKAFGTHFEIGCMLPAVSLVLNTIYIYLSKRSKLFIINVLPKIPNYILSQ